MKGYQIARLYDFRKQLWNCNNVKFDDLMISRFEASKIYCNILWFKDSKNVRFHETGLQDSMIAGCLNCKISMWQDFKMPIFQLPTNARFHDSKILHCKYFLIATFRCGKIPKFQGDNFIIARFHDCKISQVQYCMI